MFERLNSTKEVNKNILNQGNLEKPPVSSKEVISQLKALSESEYINEPDELVFDKVEKLLAESDFALGDSIDVTEVLNNNTLLCRSESITKVLDLIEMDSEIVILNEDNDANMCIMASGQGFKTAMQEGFSGREVGGIVKVVISFTGNNLLDRSVISREDDLWKTKPHTAEVSLSGRGEILKEDLEMISLRFPAKYFPISKLSEDEKDLLDEESLQFVVRHYIPIRKKTAH